MAAADVVPTFRDDAVQADVGWPLVDMTLKADHAPVILRRILREERVWCRIVEFAEEFGISCNSTLWCFRNVAEADCTWG